MGCDCALPFTRGMVWEKRVQAKAPQQGETTHSCSQLMVLRKREKKLTLFLLGFGLSCLPHVLQFGFQREASGVFVFPKAA